MDLETVITVAVGVALGYWATSHILYTGKAY